MKTKILSLIFMFSFFSTLTFADAVLISQGKNLQKIYLSAEQITISPEGLFLSLSKDSPPTKVEAIFQDEQGIYTFSSLINSPECVCWQPHGFKCGKCGGCFRLECPDQCKCNL